MHKICCTSGTYTYDLFLTAHICNSDILSRNGYPRLLNKKNTDVIKKDMVSNFNHKKRCAFHIRCKKKKKKKKKFLKFAI